MSGKSNRVTTTDIAKLAGVSQSTVSLVLNRKPNGGISSATEERVLAAAIKLGYIQPGESAANPGKSQEVAVIVPDTVNPFFADLLSDFTRYAYEARLQLVVCSTQRSAVIEREHMARLIAQNIGGILYMCTPTCLDLIEKANRRIPVVVVGESPREVKANTFASDEYRAGEMLAEHLYGLGHRKIAFVSTPINAVSVARRQRLDGVEDFLKAKGLGDSFHLYEQTSQLGCGDKSFDIAVGEALTRRLLADRRGVTAIVTVADIVALGVYSALKSAGLRIPEDMSVASFGNIEFCRHISPTMTSIDPKISLRGRYGFDYLLQLMSGSVDEEAEPLFVVYRSALIVRESTGPAPE